MIRVLVFCLAVVSLSSSSPLVAGEPALVRLTVQPSAVELTGVRARQGLIVQAEYADNSTREVTASAAFAFDNPVASIASGQLSPLADGSATLTATFAGQSVKVPVAVRRSKDNDALGFRADIMPVLNRAGCNSGKCHGSASGKDGFRLSLFGYDPDGDQFRITREAGGRRINLSTPDDCLLVNKAVGKVPHTGGKRIEPGTESYRLLLAWLEAGADKDKPEALKPVGVEVFPKEAVFASKGGTQRMIVRAKFSDGSQRDVTRFCVFLSNNDSAAKVSEEGVVTAAGPGESFVLARFDEFTAGASFIVRPGTDFTPSTEAPANYIDGLVLAKLNKLHVLPSEVCTDEVFLRRASIDLTGLLPTAESRKVFLDDTDPKKREKLVDALIARPEFTDLWIMKVAELLQIRTANGIAPKGLKVYDQWLRDRIRNGATLDVVLRELLPASGGTFENPPANYYQTETTPQLIAENVAQVFLGTRIQCAQCHNHPFDRWTLDDYYGFSAFFGRVGYKNAQDPRELTVYDTGIGETRHPITNKALTPKFLGGGVAKIEGNRDFRAVLADWIASPANDYFARNFANVVWSGFFAKGIVDPVDDVRVSNPASNAELLAALGQKAAEYKYDVKKLTRDICLSHTYQRATRKNPSNEWDERNFARQFPRRMRAENLLDCITQVTETTDEFPGLPMGSRAVHIADGRTQNYFLRTFGRATRSTACSCEVVTAPTLSQALHLLNGDTTNGKILDGRVVEKRLAAKADAQTIATELYVRCLGRVPTSDEARRIAAKLDNSPDKATALNDLFWALLNTNEFIFNR